MPLLRPSYLLALALAFAPVGASLAAQEPPPKPADPAPASTGETRPEKEQAPGTDSQPSPEHERREYRFWDHNTVFGAFAQADLPKRDLGKELDGRTGFGVGVQWTHDHGDWHASRTRMEWNTFPEGQPVGPQGTKTYAKNYLLSFDHLFKLNQGSPQVYLVTGLGGARWCLEQTTASVRTTDWTTKLAFTGGVGVELANRVNLEARYMLGGIVKTFDANTVQVSLGWHF